MHATHYEGSSIVTLEAMAHALPVAATRTGGIPDKVTTGENGFLVEPGDVAGLAAAIAPLAADPDLRRRMGRAGRERVERAFSWRAIADRTIAVYEEMLRTRPIEEPLAPRGFRPRGRREQAGGRTLPAGRRRSRPPGGAARSFQTTASSMRL